jgi:hypothetical protein
MSFYNQSFIASAGPFEMASISAIRSGTSSASNSGSSLSFSTRRDENLGSATVTLAEERMRILHNGNVGIGTTAPAFPLDICGNSGTLLRLKNDKIKYAGGQSNIEFWNASDDYPLGMIKTIDIGQGPSGAYKSKMEFVINNGTTSTASLYSQTPALKLDSTGAEAASYNATSDYRIKDCVLSLPDCSFVVDPLRPVSYRNKLTNKQDIGLIAHEVQEHFPFFVNGEKDGEHNQSINYTGFIALLIHEIQQLKQRVSDLENQANK